MTEKQPIRPDSQALDVRRLQAELRQFAADRHWERFHNPKNLVMALSVEVAELVEQFQWLTAAEADAVKADPDLTLAIEDELADIGIYLLRLADVLEIDLAPAVEAKMQRNVDRFPALGAPPEA